MEAARRPPGRLSRRRPLRAGFPPGPGPQGAASEPWAALLRAAGAGRSADCEALPGPPGQDPQPGADGPAPPEVFTVGPRTFAWTPFPPAPGAGAARRPPEPPSRARKGLAAPAAPGPALQSCPMCARAFAPQLDQLDIDSHLAQCLAEGAEDVVW